MVKYLLVAVVGLTLASSPAFAAKAAHHCVDKDGKDISLTGIAGKTPAAQCKAAHGKWVKAKASTTTAKKTTK
jgi:hypothetical protein